MVSLTAPPQIRQIVPAGPGLCQTSPQLLQTGDLLVVFLPEDDVTLACLGSAGVPAVRRNSI